LIGNGGREAPFVIFASFVVFVLNNTSQLLAASRLPVAARAE
jgi:hypothetical protein